MDTGPVREKDAIKELVPVILLDVDKLQKGTRYGLVSSLIKTITLWVIGGAYFMLNASQFEERGIQLIDKLSALIRVAALKAPQSANEAQKKSCHWVSCFVRKALSLHPFGEVIGTCNYVPIATFGSC